MLRYSTPSKASLTCQDVMQQSLLDVVEHSTGQPFLISPPEQLDFKPHWRYLRGLNGCCKREISGTGTTDRLSLLRDVCITLGKSWRNERDEE